MKKALALILTAAMLFSCLAVGVSAKRVVEVEDTKNVIIDNVYVLGAEGICNDWGGKDLVSGDFVMEWKMYSSNIDGTAPGVMGTTGGSYLNSFHVDFTNDNIGSSDVKLPYDFQVDTWYDLKWVVEGGDTAVYVNGELVGNLGSAMSSKLYYTSCSEMAVSDFKLWQGEELVHHVTYDDLDAAASVFAAQGATNPSRLMEIEIVVEEEKPEPDYVYVLGAEGICNDWGGKDLVEGDFKMEWLMYSSNIDGTAPGVMGTTGGSYLNSFHVDFTNDNIGSSDVKLDYDFQVDTWYTLTWVVEGGDTAVYVNGEHVGNLGNAMSSKLYYTSCSEMAVSDFKLWQGDDLVYHVDYSDLDYAASVFAAQGATNPSRIMVIEPEVEAPAVSNKNVNILKDNVYIMGAEGICNDWGGKDLVEGDFTMEWLMYSSNIDGTAPGTMGFTSGSYLNSFYVDFSKDLIGSADSTLAYDFQADTWYDLKWVVEGGDTAVYVNGEHVGNLGSAMSSKLYFTACYDFAVSDFKLWQGEELKYHVDYNDLDAAAAVFAAQGATDPSRIMTIETEGESYDLGLKYLDATYEEYYTWLKDCDGSHVEFDFSPAKAESYISNFTDSITLTTTGAGVGGESVNFAEALVAGEWYHIEYVGDGSSTAIYLDGAYVGTVNKAVCANSIGGHIGWLAIDNLNIGGNIDDFEDGVALENFSKDGGPDIVSDYEFEGFVEPEDPYVSLGMDVAPEGDAMIVADELDGYGCLYVKHEGKGFDISRGNVVYSFDLALVSNDHRGDPYSSEKDPDGSQTWFEIWRDTASRRFKVGFDKENDQFSGFAGDNDSLVGFDWGEFTATNFHNVVVVFDNMKAHMYIDGVLLYEGPAGSAGVDSTRNSTLYAIVGGSAIIDNFTMYDPDLNLLTTEFLGGSAENNGGLDIQPYGWTVGADCDVNGHVFGSIDVTTQETCYSLGEDTKYCAICGEGYAHVDRAMIDHNYARYDINRTADGLIYTYCQNDGCVGKKFVTPTDEAYTGTMSVYLDMSDDMAKVFPASDAPNLFANFSFADGVATTSEATYLQNYSRFDMDRFANNAPKSKDWSVTFDLTYNSTWDTDDVINSGYEHYSLYMLGGNNAAFVTLNFEKDYVKISPNTYSNPSVTVIKEAYDFVEGETYNVQFSFKQYEVVIDEWEEDGEWIVWSEPAVDFYVTINGVDVICYDYANLESDTLGISYENGESSFPGFFNQNFGVNYSIDNFVVATSDFDWTERTYVGDVDGDNYLTANDALCMRKLLAKVIDDSALATSRMDANADGAINAKDQLTIRKALAA